MNARHILAGVAIAAALSLAPATARADATSLFTAAVGTQLGMSHGTQLDASSDDRFVSELVLHARLVRVVGLQLAYNAAASDAEEERLVFHSRLRLAAQIFFVPLEDWGLYLTGGLGADGFTDLASITADSNSYQGGLGGEVYIGEHFAISAEYMMVVPGVRSIQETVLAHALKEEALTDETGSSHQGPSTSNLGAGDFVSPANFQATVGARYYF